MSNFEALIKAAMETGTSVENIAKFGDDYELDQKQAVTAERVLTTVMRGAFQFWARAIDELDDPMVKLAVMSAFCSRIVLNVDYISSLIGQTAFIQAQDPYTPIENPGVKGCKCEACELAREMSKLMVAAGKAADGVSPNASN